MSKTELAPSKRSAVKSISTAFNILKENGGEMQRKLLIEEMTKRIDFEEWETERYKSNGQLKWLTIFLFYTIDCIKAGWLIKNKGKWFLTPEGEAAIKLGPVALLENASKAYREWKAHEPKESTKGVDEKDVDISDEQIQKATLDELEAQAIDGIGEYLEGIDEYKFQKIAAVLLKTMGLYIEHIAPPGPDGGIDIIAFKDPLGFEKPRIKVQVKNYIAKNKIDIKPIRELKGLLNANEHIGIFITSSYFTKDAEMFARQSDIHIKLIDRDAFIELWQINYHKMNDEEKALLPLHPIYFLGSFES
jgi:restriction system protein